MNDRLDKLRVLIAQEGLDCLIVSQPENRRYMSGFTGSAGLLLVSALLITQLKDPEYLKKAE